MRLAAAQAGLDREEAARLGGLDLVGPVAEGVDTAAALVASLAFETTLGSASAHLGLSIVGVAYGFWRERRSADARLGIGIALSLGGLVGFAIAADGRFVHA